MSEHGLLEMEIAKRLYIDSGGPADHSEDEWESIRKEMTDIVNASSNVAAGKIIEWWGCWDKDNTKTAFARRVRIRARAYGINVNGNVGKKQIDQTCPNCAKLMVVLKNAIAFVENHRELEDAQRILSEANMVMGKE